VAIFGRKKAPASDPREEALATAFAPAALEHAGRVEEVTLLVCDMRGFTRLVERLSPPETVQFVNRYLDVVCPPIVGAGGVIDKFMGDGVLAFFEGGGHASRAVNAARHILGVMGRPIAGTAEAVRVGISLHSGQVLVGTVGPRTRREYTMIGDAVNLVTRLEEFNKMYGSVVVASAATIESVGERERAGFEGPVEVSIRGREAGIALYVLGSRTPLGDDRDLGDRLRRFVGRETE
jgi:adenylate cyclase